MNIRNLSSCQKEFASNSGSTRVAFMIRAARTALQIYNIQEKKKKKLGANISTP